MENWEARVVFRPDMMANAIYMTRSTGDGREYLGRDGKRTLHKRAAVPKDDPYLALLDEEQIAALGIAINKSGYQAPNEHLIEGKLVATERHLEDMRRLVFDPTVVEDRVVEAKS